VTLNGAVTLTSGAAVSVDPVTATLPVAPGTVHSGVPPVAGAAVGQPLNGAAGSVTEDVATSATDGDVADAGSVVSEPHAASVIANDAAQATSPTEEGTRENFMVVTLQPRCVAPSRSARLQGTAAGSVKYLRYSSAEVRCQRQNYIAPDRAGYDAHCNPTARIEGPL
jgi:hypothetical protein